MSHETAMEVALFCGADLFVPEEALAAGALPVFAPPAAPALGGPGAAGGATFAFGGRNYLALELSEESAAELQGSQRLPLRQFIGGASREAAAFALRARAYAYWASVTRYCSHCAGPLVDGRGRDIGGARVCSRCGRAYFPRISPAVIVLVRRGGQMLLAHNSKTPTARHGLIAGFVEPGETLEETVHREVMEESGITIAEPRYVRSQPWPFPDSLMIAFEADYESGEIRPDGAEIDHLGWFSPDKLPDIPPFGSVARFLIDRFIAAAE